MAITDGRITSVGDLDDEVAERRIDATGLVVAPRFVDIHTPYDARVTTGQSAWQGRWRGSSVFRQVRPSSGRGQGTR